MVLLANLTVPLFVVAVLASSAAVAGDGGDREVCFSQGEMRELEAQKTVVASVVAARAARAAVGSGKLVRAALCRRAGDYYYRLSVLRRDGRVVSVNVDGRTGKVDTARLPN